MNRILTENRKGEINGLLGLEKFLSEMKTEFLVHKYISLNGKIP